MCNSANCTHGEKKEHTHLEYNEKGEAIIKDPVSLDGQRIVHLSLNYTPLLLVDGVVGSGKTTYISQLVEKDFALDRVLILKNEVNDLLNVLGTSPNVVGVEKEQVKNLPTLENEDLSQVVIIDDYKGYDKDKKALNKIILDLVGKGYRVVVGSDKFTGVEEGKLLGDIGKYLRVTVNRQQVKGQIMFVHEGVKGKEYRLYQDTVLRM